MIRKNLPRGLRNNNPLNIRIGNVWLGEVDNPTDPDFEQFKEMRFGLRAAFVLLRRYIRHYKRTNIASIIEAWAPSSENNTARYIDAVTKLANIDPTAVLQYEDKDTMVRLVSAMIIVENGQGLDVNLISSSYELA